MRQNIWQQNAKCDTKLDPAWEEKFFLFDKRVLGTLKDEENRT